MRWTGNFTVHFAFEVAGYIAGSIVYALSRRRRGDAIDDGARATVLAGAALGAAIGSRLLHFLAEPSMSLAGVIAGKTVVGGLLGGLIGVEVGKKLSGITCSTGDLFVAPLIAAMSIGRIGCFLTGAADHTAGIATSLPWGVAIADGVPRHPVALYEIAFLLVMLFITRRVWRRHSCLRVPFPHEGDAFRVFLASYLLFRLLVDFLKPDPPPIFLGITAIQWACVAGLLYYGVVFTNDNRSAAVPFLRRRRVDLHDVLPQD